MTKSNKNFPTTIIRIIRYPFRFAFGILVAVCGVIVFSLIAIISIIMEDYEDKTFFEAIKEMRFIEEYNDMLSDIFKW